MLHQRGLNIPLAKWKTGKMCTVVYHFVSIYKPSTCITCMCIHAKLVEIDKDSTSSRPLLVSKYLLLKRLFCFGVFFCSLCVYMYVFSATATIKQHWCFTGIHIYGYQYYCVWLLFPSTVHLAPNNVIAGQNGEDRTGYIWNFTPKPSLSKQAGPAIYLCSAILPIFIWSTADRIADRIVPHK